MSSKWSGEKELKEALKALSHGASKDNIKNATNVAMKYDREYKRVVHAIEHFIWKGRTEHRLSGFYVLDAVIRKSKSKYGPKDHFIPRFLQHMNQTFQALAGLPPPDIEQVKKVVAEWIKKDYYTEDTIKDVGGSDFIPPRGNFASSDGKVDVKKLSNLLGLIKQHQTGQPQNDTDNDTHRDGRSSPPSNYRPVANDNYSRNFDGHQEFNNNRHSDSRWNNSPRQRNGPGRGPPSSNRFDDSRQPARRPASRDNRDYYGPSSPIEEPNQGLHYGPPGNDRRNDPSRQRDKGKMNEICMRFQIGKCVNGDRCRFVHEKKLGSATIKKGFEMLKKTKMCNNFPLGKCKFGDGCHFAHSKDELVVLNGDVLKGPPAHMNENRRRFDPPPNRHPPAPSHYGNPPPFDSRYSNNSSENLLPPPNQPPVQSYGHYGPPAGGGLLPNPAETSKNTTVDEFGRERVPSSTPELPNDSIIANLNSLRNIGVLAPTEPTKDEGESSSTAVFSLQYDDDDDEELDDEPPAKRSKT